MMILWPVTDFFLSEPTLSPFCCTPLNETWVNKQRSNLEVFVRFLWITCDWYMVRDTVRKPYVVICSSVSSDGRVLECKRVGNQVSKVYGTSCVTLVHLVILYQGGGSKSNQPVPFSDNTRPLNLLYSLHICLTIISSSTTVLTLSTTMSLGWNSFSPSIGPTLSPFSLETVVSSCLCTLEYSGKP